jgi:TRAP-type C4-dicarboxylate transport system substrate-binding protein
VNKEVWASWTPADQEAVRQAALQAGRENVEKARKGIAGSDNAVLKQIEASGVTVTTLTPEQRDAFVKATRPVYDKWAKTIGADLVKKAETAIAKR